MRKKRLIPLLLLKDGLLVRSQKFKTHQVIGNPMSTVSRFLDWDIDVDLENFNIKPKFLSIMKVTTIELA